MSVMKLVQHKNGAMTVKDFTAGCRAEAEAADNELTGNCCYLGLAAKLCSLGVYRGLSSCCACVV